MVHVSMRYINIMTTTNTPQYLLFGIERQSVTKVYRNEQ
jgi:hypothetical protein